MGYDKAFKTPLELTAVARVAFDSLVGQYATNSLFPKKENYSLEYSLGSEGGLLPPAAKFRSFSTESMVNTTETGSSRSGKLPPISIRIPVDEWQQLSMYGNSEAIAAKLEEYAERNAQSIAQRVVLAQAEALTSGTVTINERGITTEVDFARKAENDVTVTVPWSDHATSDPIADLTAYREAFGKSISSITISRAVMGHLQRNAKIREMLGVTYGMVSEAQVRAALTDYGFGAVTVNEETIRDTTGAEVPLFDPAKVIIVSGSSVGSTQVGVTAEAIDPDNGIAQAEQPGLFAGSKSTEDPKGINVYTAGILLPVLSTPNNTGTLDVL